MSLSKKPMVTALAVALAGSFPATVANAQSALEEVTVTAQKREQNLQDVGISVTAFGGRQLEQMGMTSSVDITQQVPSMQLQTFTPAVSCSTSTVSRSCAAHRARCSVAMPPVGWCTT